MFKLVAIDLDGTLLNSYSEVTEKTKLALKKATQNGVEVVLASRQNNKLCREYSKRSWSRQLLDFRKWIYSI